MTELNKILQRFDRGYTVTLYGSVQLANFQKEHDFLELTKIVKKLMLTDVSQRSEQLFALLDWIDYGDKEDKKYIVETFLKDIYSK